MDVLQKPEIKTFETAGTVVVSNDSGKLFPSFSLLLRNQFLIKYGDKILSLTYGVF